jgi:hypothetical protein
MAKEELDDKEQQENVDQVNVEDAEVGGLQAVSNETTQQTPPANATAPMTTAPTTVAPTTETPTTVNAPPMGGGTATAVAPTTGTAATGVVGGNAALAPPVSAGATGSNAGNNDSPTASSGMGSSPTGGGSGDGTPQNAGNQNAVVSNNDTFKFDASKAMKGLTRGKAEVGSMSFLDKTIAFTKQHFEIDKDANTASIVDFNLGSIENRLFSFSEAKIDSIVFSTQDASLQSITISSGAVSLLSAKGFYYGESMKATLNKGQSEYQVSVEKANVNIGSDAIAINNGYFRLGTDGKFIEAGAPHVKSLFFEATEIKITPNGVMIGSLAAGVNVLGKSIGVTFSGISVVDGKVNGTGTLTPMTDLTFMNGKGTFTNPSATVNIVDNQVSGVITTGIVYDGGLFTADEIKAQISGKEVALSMDKAVLNIMGEPVGLAETYIRVGTNGEFLEAGAGIIETRKFKAQGVSVLPDGLRVKEVEAILPPVLGKPLDVKFQELSAVNGLWNATGTITPDGELSYMNDKLKLPGLNAQISIVDNKFAGTLSSQITYNDPDKMVKANGLGTITVGETSSFQLANGTAEAELSGMKFVGEGVEMSADANRQAISIKKGNLNVPYFNDKFNVDIKGGLIDSETGFKFDEMKLATGGVVEVLPNFKVSGTVIVKRNASTQQYDVSVVGGVVDYKGGPGGLEIGAKVNFNYNAETGLAGKITKPDIKTNFADFNAPGTIDFNADGFTMPTVAAKVKGIGPTPLTATANNVVYNKEKGFSVEKLNTTFPKIGETTITSEVNNLAISNSLSVGEVKVGFSSGNQISLAGGKVLLNSISGGASIGADGKWGFNIGSNLTVNGIPNFEGSGRVNVGYDSTGPILDVQDGSIKTSFNGIDVKATGLGYDVKTKKLMVRKAEVAVPEFKGVQVTATANKVSVGPSGFEGDLKLTAAGAVELMDGVKITKLEGAYSNKKGVSKISMNSSATIQTDTFSGEVKKIAAEFSGTQKTFSAEGLSLQTPYFDVLVAKAKYDSAGEGSFSMEQARVTTRGLDKFGNPQATATGITYDKNGFKMASFNAALGFEDQKQAIMLNGSNINLPAKGTPTGTAQITLANSFALAGGAIKVAQPRALATMAPDGWDLSIEGMVEVAAAGGSAQGLVSIGYNKTTGLRAGVSNGSFTAHFASLGLTVAAKNINYDYAKKAVTVDSGTVTATKIGSGLTGEISGLSISGKDINFKDLKVAASGINFEVVKGVNVALNTATLSKNGNSLIAKLEGGINIDSANPKVKASTQGTLTYDITKNKLDGNVKKFKLETSIFTTTVNDINFSRTGFTIAQAELGLSESIDPKAMQKYIPGFQPWMLDFVKGVKFVAQDISYTKEKGLQIGTFYPDIAPIPFSLMDGALTGELDLKNQKGFLEGNKTFQLPGINTPTFTIPIVAGVSGEIKAGVKASMSMGARIDLAKKEDYWDLSGGISLGADISAYVYGGVSVSVVVASISAGIEVSANLSAKGSASLAGGIRYNPTTKAVELATPLRFNYSLLAKLTAKLQLQLRAYALGCEAYANDIDLAEWEIGSLGLTGESQSPDFAGLWGNLKNKAKLDAFGSTVYES